MTRSGTPRTAARSWQSSTHYFAERDNIEAQKSTATLSQAFQAIVAEFLSKAAAQAEFDRDIFARLVDKVIIKSRDNIIFVLKDGAEVKADTSADIAA